MAGNATWLKHKESSSDASAITVVTSKWHQNKLSSVMTHPTLGRRRKVKRPPPNIPDLPLIALRRSDTSSEEPEEQRVHGEDSKRLRSTSNTPGSASPASDSGRARAPFDELDKLIREFRRGSS